MGACMIPALQLHLPSEWPWADVASGNLLPTPTHSHFKSFSPVPSQKPVFWAQKKPNVSMVTGTGSMLGPGEHI